MNDWNHKDIFEIAWKHFEVVAEQRLKAFHFYVLMLAASVGASLTALEKHAEFFVVLMCGLFCIGSSIAFLLIEVRTRRLLQIPKNVMTALEIGDHWPQNLRLFSVDNLRQEGLWKSIVSYSAAIRGTMIAHLLFGILLVLMSFCPALNPNLDDSSHKSPKNTIPLSKSQP
jgi:hypothetical protein